MIILRELKLFYVTINAENHSTKFNIYPWFITLINQ